MVERKNCQLNVKLQVARVKDHSTRNQTWRGMCSKFIKLNLGPQEDLSVQDVMSPFHAEKI